MTALFTLAAGCAAQNPQDNHALGGNWSFDFDHCGTADEVAFLTVEYTDLDGYFVDGIDGRFVNAVASSPDDDTVEVTARDDNSGADVTFTLHDDGASVSATVSYGSCATESAGNVHHDSV